MNHESEEVRRLQNELNSGEVSGASGSLGGLIDAINKLTQQLFRIQLTGHNDRSKRLLHRVDVSRANLALSGMARTKTSVPPSSFEVLQKSGKSWEKSTIEITSAGFSMADGDS